MASLFKLGPSTPQPTATIGYSINHFALVTANLDASIKFYTEVLGMRLIFRYDIPISSNGDGEVEAGAAAQEFSMAYLGYPVTSEQTSQEMLDNRTASKGLLELISYAPSAQLLKSTSHPTAFSHIGLIVPDLKATEARMREHSVPILKAVGEPVDFKSVEGAQIGMAFAVGHVMSGSPTVIKSIAAAVKEIGFEALLIVKDPDGNILEVQPQRSGF